MSENETNEHQELETTTTFQRKWTMRVAAVAGVLLFATVFDFPPGGLTGQAMGGESTGCGGGYYDEDTGQFIDESGVAHSVDGLTGVEVPDGSFTWRLEMNSRKWAASKNSISIKLHGADGEESEWGKLGRYWKSSETREGYVAFPDVDWKVGAVTFRSSGTDSWLFDVLTLVDPAGGTSSFVSNGRKGLKCKNRSTDEGCYWFIKNESTTYRYTINIDHKRWAGTKNTIVVQFHGAKGEESSWNDLGANWTSSEIRTGELTIAGPHWPITGVSMRIDGTDSWLFSTFTLTDSDDAETHFVSNGRKGLKCKNKTTTEGCFWYIETSAGAPTVQGQCVSCDISLIDQGPAALETSSFEYGNELIHLPYTGFEVWVDCEKRAPVRFEYTARKDCGCEKRAHGFKRDPESKSLKTEQTKDCQQYNGKAYPKDAEGVAYDRGHMVPANHLDGNKESITQSNYMTNILPQAASMNRGAWLLTEEIIECLRDHEPLRIFGGAVFDETSPQEKIFRLSHGVSYPLAFWKVIIAPELSDNHPGERIMVWWVPNDPNAKRSTLDKFVISLEELEQRLGEFGVTESFNFSPEEKAHTPKGSWDGAFWEGCNKG